MIGSQRIYPKVVCLQSLIVQPLSIPPLHGVMLDVLALLPCKVCIEQHASLLAAPEVCELP